MRRRRTPRQFYQAGGTLSADAPSYVPRQADRELREHIMAGDLCYVLTPRQMGKSSLVTQTAAQLQKKHIHSVVIDLQGKIERGMTVEAFYTGLLKDVVQELRLPVKLIQWWKKHAELSAVQRFSDFVADEVMSRIQKKLVIFIDEIDSTLNLAFSDDFFAALRSFYNRRARDPAFTRLTFVLLGMASPSDLIKDRTLSPFNVGYSIELTDFSPGEARKLAQGFPLAEKTAGQLLDRVLYWTGGHPYLTQRVCASLVAAKPWQQKTTESERLSACIDALIDTLFFASTLR